MQLIAPAGHAASLVPFPLSARAGDIRRAAALLTIRHLTEEAATNRWIRITDRLAREMEACGFDPIVIALELCSFEDAVKDEIERRQSFDRH
jgi:hypothetical protein